MDEDIKKAFENINVKLDSIGSQVNFTHTEVIEIKNQILINSKKLDAIYSHLGLKE